ncbi:MAG: TIGR04282 family arsenosugar biosynthesis glycosyltransferase [Proteobacteria bacterium]|nr:TIGR04282 family arsenosugar biosynthesis glycosyltransferase [Pseudomonadota bacterium]
MGRICVMAKAPVAGQVKTRLARSLGDEGALVAHIELAERTLGCVERTGFDVELWIGEACDTPLVATWCERYDLVLMKQPVGDLGVRMLAALDKAVVEKTSALIIGTDIPTLTPVYLLQAMSALDDADLVLGPVEDGGYCLIGAKRSYPQLFNDMLWSTSGVYAETVRRAQEAKLRLHAMPELWDVDRLSDWERYLDYRKRAG